MKKPKIAILSIKNSYQHGGVLATLKTVYDFCERYFEPTIFTLGFDKTISAHMRPPKFSSSMRLLDYLGMRCIEIGSRWAFWEPGHYAFTVQQWREALAGYDYIFVVSATPIAAHPALLIDKKFVLWASTSYQADRSERAKALTGFRRLSNYFAEKKMDDIEQLIVEKASFILPLSTYSKNLFDIILAGRKKPMAICGYPIEVPEKNEQLSYPKTVIAVGRFSDPRKNISMLMRVFGHLALMLPGVRMIVVGQAPAMEILAPFTRHEWFDQITFTGAIDAQTLNEMYAHASVMLITSYQEGFGIAGLEAMARGLPVVATDCGGVRDFVLDGQTGFLVPIDDDKDMAMKASTLLVNYHLYQEFSRAGRMLVAQQFSRERVHALFQHALTTTYPELATLFTNDEEYSDNQPYVYSPH